IRKRFSAGRELRPGHRPGWRHHPGRSGQPGDFRHGGGCAGLLSVGPTRGSVAVTELTRRGRWVILVTGFLGWLFAGVHMSITQLTAQSAAIDLLARTGEIDGSRYLDLNRRAQAKESNSPLSPAEKEEWQRGKTLAGRWFAIYQSAF